MADEIESDGTVVDWMIFWDKHSGGRFIKGYATEFCSEIALNLFGP
jgi:hypothetical protein